MYIFLFLFFCVVALIFLYSCYMLEYNIPFFISFSGCWVLFSSNQMVKGIITTARLLHTSNALRDDDDVC